MCTTPSPARAGTWSLETERFGTTSGETRRLRDWLVERRVELVVMEATSDYWRPLEVIRALRKAVVGGQLAEPDALTAFGALMAAEVTYVGATDTLLQN